MAHTSLRVAFERITKDATEVRNTFDCIGHRLAMDAEELGMLDKLNQFLKCGNVATGLIIACRPILEAMRYVESGESNGSGGVWAANGKPDQLRAVMVDIDDLHALCEAFNELASA